MMKQLTRQRLLTTLNNYMTQGDERRSLQSAPKASLLRPLAKLLLTKKIVVLSEGATLQNVKRQDVNVRTCSVNSHKVPTFTISTVLLLIHKSYTRKHTTNIWKSIRSCNGSFFVYFAGATVYLLDLVFN